MASTEAPFSITFKMLDPNGIDNMITLRADSNELPEVSALLEDRDSLVAQMIENGWQPLVNGSAGRTYQQDNGSNNSGSGNSRGGRYGSGNGNQNRQQQSNNAGGSENCRCGVPGVRKSGNKNGRQWSAIMCRNRNCDPIFD